MSDGLLFVLIFGGGLAAGSLILWFGIFRQLFAEQAKRHARMFGPDQAEPTKAADARGRRMRQP